MPSPSALPSHYLAMALTDALEHRLRAIECTLPALAPNEIRLRVRCCGVCRTDLHLVDGELPHIPLPCIPGHEIVGTVVELGTACTRLAVGQRVGVPWLGSTCGTCPYCAGGRENLCARAQFTGYQLPGGYAQYTVAQEAYAFELPSHYSDEQAAPLLCAGLIGFRALAMLPDAQDVGIYGFGAAGHLIAQVALAQGRRVYAFTREGDSAAQMLARTLGVTWAGASSEAPPRSMDGAILFAPVGALVPQALQHLMPGGTVVCAGIHMSDIPSFPYRWLWQERCIRSVANLTRADGIAFFEWASHHNLQLSTHTYPLEHANQALDDLRAGAITGAAVLTC